MFLRNIGPTELIIIFMIVLLVFGVGRVSKIGRELGTAVSAFRKGIKEDMPEDELETVS